MLTHDQLKDTHPFRDIAKHSNANSFTRTTTTWSLKNTVRAKDHYSETYLLFIIAQGVHVFKCVLFSIIGLVEWPLNLLCLQTEWPLPLWGLLHIQQG